MAFAKSLNTPKRQYILHFWYLPSASSSILFFAKEGEVRWTYCFDFCLFVCLICFVLFFAKVVHVYFLYRSLLLFCFVLFFCLFHCLFPRSLIRESKSFSAKCRWFEMHAWTQTRNKTECPKLHPSQFLGLVSAFRLVALLTNSPMTRQKIKNKRIALKEKNTFLYFSESSFWDFDQKSVHLDYFDIFTVEKQQQP